MNKLVNMSNIEPDICLSEEQIADFWERGYLCLSAITSTEEVNVLRGVF